MENDIEGKLDNLEERINAAREASIEHGTTEKKIDIKENHEAIKSGRAGSEFLANIIAGWVLGFALDWFFGTKPWGMIIFMILGFVGGVYRANRAMQKNGK